MGNKKVSRKYIELIEKLDIRIFIIVFIALVMLPILYLSFFSFPVADDFDYADVTYHALQAEDGGLLKVVQAALQEVVYAYNTWQGTYTSVFLMTLPPSIFGEQYYFITIWLMLGVTLFGFLYTGKKLLHLINVEKKTACFLSLVVWFFYIQTIPSPREGLFWYNGSVHYMVFFVLTLLFASMLISELPKTINWAKVVIISILGFVISGGNQLTSLLNILVMLLMIGYLALFSKKLTKIKFLIAPLISSLVGFLIMIFAPGNAVRQSVMLNTPTIIETVLKVGIFSYFDFAFTEWFSLSFVLLLLFLTPYIINITKKLSGFKLQKLVLLILAQYMLVCGMLCAPYYAMGEVGNFGGGKAINIVYPVFFVSVIIIYGYTVGLLQEKKILSICIDNIPKIYQKIIAVFFSAVVFLGIFFCGSNYFGYSTSGLAISEIIGGVHTTYKQQMDQRLIILKDDSIKDVVFEPHVYSIFFGYDVLNTKSNIWPNTSFAHYYGKDSVSIKAAE